MKTKIIIVALLIALGAYGTFRYVRSKDDNDTSTVSKETTVSYGDVIVGVTESSTIEISSLSQTFDLSFVSASVSASVAGGTSGNSGSTDNSGTSGGTADGGSAMNGMQNASASGGNSGSSAGGSNQDSTSVSTSTSTSDIELVVDEVFITEGQTVAKGDKLMSITQDSIDTAKEELESAVKSTKLALTQAKIDQSDTLLEAKYEYDSRITAGKSAEEKYNATLESISNNISVLQTSISDAQSEISSLETEISEAEDNQASQLENQLTQLQSELENYESQLSSAQSTKSSDELTAKQDYEETLMYYENAQSLYDIAISDVDDATTTAQENVATAKENLETFKSYVQDNTIKAEYSGTISTVSYVSGDTLSTDTAIAEYADAQAITVSVSVTEDDISVVNLDDVVEVEFLAYPDKTFEGYVSEIGSSSSTSNTTTVSYPVTIVITSYPDTILTGMTANVTFIKKQVNDVLYVSNKAIQSEGTKSYLKKVKSDGTTEKVEIETGFSNGTNVEVSSGVSEGDTVLIESKVKSE